MLQFLPHRCLRTRMNNTNIEDEKQQLNELSGKVIGLCIEIHRELGPGLLESAYEECLAYELSKTGLRFERQKPLPVRYKEVQLDCGYRLDFVIEKSLIVELKAVSELQPIHEAQLLTYLKLDKKSLGLTINFNVPLLKQGVKRVTCGNLFKEETGGRGFGARIVWLLLSAILCWLK
jgi:GxxExxY protein